MKDNIEGLHIAAFQTLHYIRAPLGIYPITPHANPVDMPKISRNRRRVPEPRPMVFLEHYHPTTTSRPSDSLSLHPADLVDLSSLELVGQTPCFTKHRDGSLDAGNLCLYLPGPLAGLLKSRADIEPGWSKDEREKIVDPELLSLDVEMPNTPDPKTRDRELDVGREVDLVDEETIQRMLGGKIVDDEDDQYTVSPSISIGAASYCLYPESPTSIVSPSPSPPLLTEFVPRKRNLARFIESLKRPRRPRRERDPKHWPDWQKMTERREKNLAYFRVYDKARRGVKADQKSASDLGSDPGNPNKKRIASSSGSIVKRRARDTSTDSTLTSLSDSSRSASPVLEIRSRSRDSESLTPLADSSSSSSFPSSSRL